MTLPKFLVVGAAKAGTTSIYSYLRQNPAIYLAELKESNFLVGFDPQNEQAKIYRRQVIINKPDYFALFEAARNDQIPGEVCPLYLYYYDRTIPRIKQYLKSGIKIIIILRNPIDRCYSGYNMYASQGLEPLSFADSLLESNRSDLKNPHHWRRHYNLTCGLYFHQVSAYLKEFEKNHVRVFRFESLVQNTRQVLGEITQFLELPPFAYDTSEVMNVTQQKKQAFIYRILDKRTRQIRNSLAPYVSKELKLKYRQLMYADQKIPLNAEVQSYLQDYYQTDIDKLQNLLCWDLNSWIENSTYSYS